MNVNMDTLELFEHVDDRPKSVTNISNMIMQIGKIDQKIKRQGERKREGCPSTLPPKP